MDLLNLRFGNAAGTIKTLEQVEKACKSAMNDITVGSVTLEARAGNSGDTYYFDSRERWSLNALGLPNPGLDAYKKVLSEMRKRAHTIGKKLRVSVAGFSPNEYAILAHDCFDCGADDVELNLGCPNVWTKVGQKPIPSYDPELAAAIFHEVERAVDPLQVDVKISPVEDSKILRRLAETISKSKVVSKIVAVNTIPNKQGIRDDGRYAISFDQNNKKNNFGGLAGAPLRDEALRVIKAISDIVPNKKIIAAGGIFTGADVVKFLSIKNVRGFQCATAYLEYGPKLFSEILSDLAELV